MDCPHGAWDELTDDGELTRLPTILRCRDCGEERRLVRRGAMQWVTITCVACGEPMEIEMKVTAAQLDSGRPHLHADGHGQHACVGPVEVTGR